jgi:hypothetical protein
VSRARKKKRDWWKIGARAALVAGFAVCVFAPAGMCLAAGLAGAAVSARSDAGRWGGKKYWRSYRRSAAWSVAGFGYAKGLRAAYKAGGGAWSNSRRIGVGRGIGRSGRKRFGLVYKKKWRYHGSIRFHDAKMSVVTTSYSNRGNW